MKIKNMSWENYRGLDDHTIIVNGKDVMISGRNGAGKSSIASVLPFILFGTDANKTKHYDDGILPADDGLVHAAQIEFDDGLTLRREYSWNGKSNSQKLYIDGQAVKQDEFKAQVDQITNGGGELLFNPFSFCKLHFKEQRTLLIKLFADKSEADLLNSEKFAEVKNVLVGVSADKFLVDTKKIMDYYKTQAATLEPAINELESQLQDAPQGDVTELESQRQKLNEQRFELIAPKTSDEEKNLKNEIDKLRDERNKLTPKQDGYLPADLADAKKFAAQLTKSKADALAEYYKILDSVPGNCPTCGQKMPLDKFNAARDKKLADIVAHGKDIAATLDKTQKRVEDLTAKAAAQDAENETRLKRLAEVESQLQSLSAKLLELQAADKATRRDKVSKLDKQIDEINEQIFKFTQADQTQKRIDKLRADKRDLYDKIAQAEKYLAIVRDFQHEKILTIEEEINSKFKHVTFKLFDFLITTGEAKETCEATLHGVPYGALSKGERLKSALDIFSTLQDYYGVQMPLFIDDAESYTQNSFVDLPNQKFFFRVDERDLLIATV